MILQNSPGFPLDRKQRIMRDWVAFIERGFTYSGLSDELSDFLTQFLWRIQGFGHSYLSMAPRNHDKALFWLAHFDRDIPALDRFLREILSIFNHPDIADRIASYPASADIDACIACLLQVRYGTIDKAIGDITQGRFTGQPTDRSELQMSEAVSEAIVAAFRRGPERRTLTQPALFASWPGRSVPVALSSGSSTTGEPPGQEQTSETSDAHAPMPVRPSRVRRGCSV
jgi:hypothetical protein